ncbi:hypothetical protein NA57DRAFT_34824 [Rhizodiscina lignyota]|uniref:2'-phosphotransferase n=1 Tax=Rhizodiscina lignyota TaxID=1504668 RepID=A0A9P4IPI2_9PEZI|nr:hypothetical protein NA57DRAFT_34824 [Rhizodiscina lignyota]
MSSRRGGRGRGGGGQGGLPREVQVSKKLSWLLRHHAENQGLKLGPGGYVNLKDALSVNALKGMRITLDEVREVVADNEKQRFSLIPITAAPDAQQNADSVSGDDAATVSKELPPDFDAEDPANYLIRANQGHSIKVDDEGLLTPISADDPSGLPEIVVHGTTWRAWPIILKTGGLKRMSRNHIHFAGGLPEGFEPLDDDDDGQEEANATDENPAPRAKKDPVISGMRNTSTILIYLDFPAALAAGLKFGRSENGVILTEGDEHGFVPTKFFKRVEERKGGYGVLMKNGEVIKELPKHLVSGGGGGGGRGGRGKQGRS